MAKVAVFHNLHSDAYKGLSPSHPLVWVFEYTAKGFAEDGELLNDAFEMFNIGEGPVGQIYRSNRLRSLSVGDVIGIDLDRFWACEKVGWRLIPRSEMHWLSARDAEDVIRERYGIGEREVLSISVPLPD